MLNAVHTYVCVHTVNTKSWHGLGLGLHGRAHWHPIMAIRFLLLQNRAGKTRLAKYYTPVVEGDKSKLEYEVHRAIVNRDPKHTNFSEVG